MDKGLAASEDHNKIDDAFFIPVIQHRIKMNVRVEILKISW